MRIVGRILRWLGIVVLAALLAGAIYQQIGAWIDARSLRPPGRIVAVDGRRIHVLCTGAGERTLVLDSRAGGWSTMWYRLQPALAQHWRVCSLESARPRMERGRRRRFRRRRRRVRPLPDRGRGTDRATVRLRGPLAGRELRAGLRRAESAGRRGLGAHRARRPEGPARGLPRLAPASDGAAGARLALRCGQDCGATRRHADLVAFLWRQGVRRQRSGPCPISRRDGPQLDDRHGRSLYRSGAENRLAVPGRPELRVFADPDGGDFGYAPAGR